MDKKKSKNPVSPPLFFYLMSSKFGNAVLSSEMLSANFTEDVYGVKDRL